MDQTQQLAQLHAYTYEKMSHDHTGHDMAHIERVVKMARTLNEKLGGNSFVVQQPYYMMSSMRNYLPISTKLKPALLHKCRL